MALFLARRRLEAPLLPPLNSKFSWLDSGRSEFKILISSDLTAFAVIVHPDTVPRLEPAATF